MPTRSRVRSAGILLHRCQHDPESDTSTVEILIGHMGGPFWASKEQGAWSIPKGLVDANDSDDLDTARREFREETGHDVPATDLVDLGVFAQSRAKDIHIWAGSGDIDANSCQSNTFDMEWPSKSGQIQAFPEFDRFEWSSIETSANRLVVGQQQVLHALRETLRKNTCTGTCTDSS